MKQYLLVSCKRYSYSNSTEIEYFGEKENVFAFTKEFITKGIMNEKDTFSIYEMEMNEIFKNKIIWGYYQLPEKKYNKYYFENFEFDQNFIE